MYRGIYECACLAYLPNFGEYIVYGITLSSLCICYADVASDSIAGILQHKGVPAKHMLDLYCLAQ